VATQKLTDKTILAAKAEEGERLELWDEQTPGLCLRVSGAGRAQSKAWVWRYRTIDGRQPRLKLADYSDSHGLKWAREQVEELRVRVRKGDDPAGEKRTERSQAKAEPIKTFNDLADAFIEASEKGHWKPRKKQKRPRTIADEIGVLKRYVRPKIGADRLEVIDRRAIRRILNDMMDRGIGAQTNRTHAIIRQVFAYGIAQERVSVNPAIGIDKPATETPRTRVLSDDELKRLWAICESCPVELRLPAIDDETQGRRFYASRGLRIAIELTMLLLTRRNEIAGMNLAELNLKERTWLIPAARMKGGVSHLVPLAPRAVELIEEAITIGSNRRGEGVFVFPSPRGENRPIRPDSITHTMAALCAVTGIEGASPHDLRRTASTILTSERLGISPFIRSKLLAHSSDTGGGAAVSSAHYDANEYVSEKRRALEAWEGLLLEIVGERVRVNNVHQFGESA
jgi:integrase